MSSSASSSISILQRGQQRQADPRRGAGPTVILPACCSEPYSSADLLSAYPLWWLPSTGRARRRASSRRHQLPRSLFANSPSSRSALRCRLWPRQRHSPATWGTQKLWKLRLSCWLAILSSLVSESFVPLVRSRALASLHRQSVWASRSGCWRSC
jgi:hypothetical protein